MNTAKIDKTLVAALTREDSQKEEKSVTCLLVAYDDQTLDDLERFLPQIGTTIKHKLKIAKALAVDLPLSQVELLSNQTFVKQIRMAYPQQMHALDSRL